MADSSKAPQAVVLKKSLFERQREEAEAKRLREEAETAAVLKEFVEDFDHEPDPSRSSRFASSVSAPQSLKAATLHGGASKRYFASSKVLKSGPGSLGPAPPSSLTRRKEVSSSDERHSLKFDLDQLDKDMESSSVTKLQKTHAFHHSDDEDEDRKAAENAVAPKPTLQLSSLPPGTSLSFIKSLIPSNIQVDSVRLLTQQADVASSSTLRKSLTAHVTLKQDTSASDVDAAITSLQNRYLGLGFRLAISRSFASALASSTAAFSSEFSSLGLVDGPAPFGAKPAYPIDRLHNCAPPPLPPPAASRDSYHRSRSSAVPLQVMVRPPSDLRELKLIHMTIEAVLSHGPDFEAFEALLMSRPEVQKDERWAWLWNARSIGGRWYRWKLWDILSGSTGRRKHIVFFSEPEWLQSDERLKFEYSTELSQFVHHPDYNSSDEEDLDERPRGGGAGEGKGGGLARGDEEQLSPYLNPLRKAKLAFLLSRLPTAPGLLREGDVARVTAFGISYSYCGAEEVVAMLVDNVERPYALSSANRGRQEQKDDDRDGDDPSAAKLIGLFLISDLLSSSTISGVRQAWRYRQLFEKAIGRRRIFKRLGEFDKEMGWGRMRVEKWRRAVTQVLELWEGWCVFTNEVHQQFLKEFNESAEQAKAAKDEEASDKVAAKGFVDKRKTTWKTVDASQEAQVQVQDVLARQNDAIADVTMEDVDGEAMVDDYDDGDDAVLDENLDGEPMADSSDEEEDEEQAPATAAEDGKRAVEDGQSAAEMINPADIVAEDVVMEPGLRAAEARRRRPRAVDLL